MATDLVSIGSVDAAAEINPSVVHAAQEGGGGGALRFSIRRGRLIPILVAVVLIFAAVGKTSNMYSEGMGEPTVASRGLLGLIELESAISCCLLLGLWPHVVRGIAVVLFVAFTGAALSKVAARASSCACAGDLVTIAPIVAVGADLLVLAGLSCWRPTAAFRFAPVKASLIVPFLGLAAWTFFGAFQPPPYPRVAVTPLVDLGELAPGERRSFLIELRNPHDQPVHIVALDSSCRCLESNLAATVVAARQSDSLSLTLDLSREPAFAGPLSVALTGRTANGAGAFSTRVAAMVRRVDSASGSSR